MKVIIDGEEYIKKSDIERLIYRLNTEIPEEKELFEQVEQALGFKLFKWQKSYIISGKFRCYGKTLAECLRILLAVDGEPLDFSRNTQSHKEMVFRSELREIEKKLKTAGIPTRHIFWNHRDRDNYFNNLMFKSEVRFTNPWDI